MNTCKIKLKNSQGFIVNYKLESVFFISVILVLLAVGAFLTHALFVGSLLPSIPNEVVIASLTAIGGTLFSLYRWLSPNIMGLYLLLSSNLYSVGDTVKIDKYIGQIKQITFFNTVIFKIDSEQLIYLPNSELSNISINNFTKDKKAIVLIKGSLKTEEFHIASCLLGNTDVVDERVSAYFDSLDNIHYLLDSEYWLSNIDTDYVWIIGKYDIVHNFYTKQTLNQIIDALVTKLKVVSAEIID